VLAQKVAKRRRCRGKTNPGGHLGLDRAGTAAGRWTAATAAPAAPVRRAAPRRPALPPRPRPPMRGLPPRRAAGVRPRRDGSLAAARRTPAARTRPPRRCRPRVTEGTLSSARRALGPAAAGLGVRRRGERQRHAERVGDEQV
jgi:hypothetical protein